MQSGSYQQVRSTILVPGTTSDTIGYYIGTDWTTTPNDNKTMSTLVMNVYLARENADWGLQVGARPGQTTRSGPEQTTSWASNSVDLSNNARVLLYTYKTTFPYGTNGQISNVTITNQYSPNQWLTRSQVVFTSIIGSRIVTFEDVTPQVPVVDVTSLNIVKLEPSYMSNSAPGFTVQVAKKEATADTPLYTIFNEVQQGFKTPGGLSRVMEYTTQARTTSYFNSYSGSPVYIFPNTGYSLKASARYEDTMSEPSPIVSFVSHYYKVYVSSATVSFQEQVGTVQVSLTTVRDGVTTESVLGSGSFVEIVLNLVGDADDTQTVVAPITGTTMNVEMPELIPGQTYVCEVRACNKNTNTHKEAYPAFTFSVPLPPTSVYIKQGGQWKKDRLYLKVGNSWKVAHKCYVKIDDEWRESTEN